jgi:hypothetical protein
MWTFLWYPDGTDNPWLTWYEKQDARVKGAHDRCIDFLKVREVHEWRIPYSDKLETYDGIYEIRIKTKVQHRLLGAFSPGRQFVILLSCTHKDKAYVPKDALNTAERRLKEVKNGTVTPIQCEPP